jgi:hypothetical protein
MIGIVISDIINTIWSEQLAPVHIVLGVIFKDRHSNVVLIEDVDVIALVLLWLLL